MRTTQEELNPGPNKRIDRPFLCFTRFTSAVAGAFLPVLLIEIPLCLFLTALCFVHFRGEAAGEDGNAVLSPLCATSAFYN